MIPKNIEKVDRSKFLTFLDTTPTTDTMTFAVLGIGITNYGISYNPQVETEKWIIEDNARSDHESNQKQSSVSQKIYKNDPCFEFVKNGRDKLNYVTHILDVDRFDGTGEGTSAVYPAKLSDGLVAITQFMNDNAVIEYDLYYTGDPIEGTVQFDENGKPTFTASNSL